MNASNADPALGTKGGGANEANRNQAGDGEPEDWKEKWFKRLESEALQDERNDNADARRNPVVVRVRVVRLALSARNEKTSNGEHAQAGVATSC